MNGPAHNPVALVKRCRLAAGLAGLAIMLAAAFLGGGGGLLGALLGVLVVEVNLSLMVLALKRKFASAWDGVPPSLGPTLIRYYLCFGATALFCVLAIKFQWGHPLAFLGGLLSFFLGVVFTALSLVWASGDRRAGPAQRRGTAPPVQPPRPGKFDGSDLEVPCKNDGSDDGAVHGQG